VGAILLFTFNGERLIGLYLHEDGNADKIAQTLLHSMRYLRMMLWGLPAFGLTQVYASTLRETGETALPMRAGIIAVFVNLVFNWILIFGHLGLPALGVEGAAIATVLSRFVELIVVSIYSHRRVKEFPFFGGVFRGFRIPKDLTKKLLQKALPLMANETLWAAGIAMVNQSYSLRSLDAMAANNISQTFWNVFSIAFLAVGNAIAIILGQMLGAGQLKEAKASSYKLVAFSFAISTLVGAVYFLAAQYIPYLYNTEQEIRDLATLLMQIAAIAMPFDALAHASYFSLRSGGKMFVTVLFDSVFMWCVNVLLAFILSRFTTVSFPAMFAIIQAITLVKAVLGILLLRSDFWVKNITENTK
jgi:putative MATE family efflux protein